jgi:hypothetical protein
VRSTFTIHRDREKNRGLGKTVPTRPTVNLLPTAVFLPSFLPLSSLYLSSPLVISSSSLSLVLNVLRQQLGANRTIWNCEGSGQPCRCACYMLSSEPTNSSPKRTRVFWTGQLTTGLLSCPWPIRVHPSCASTAPLSLCRFCQGGRRRSRRRKCSFLCPSHPLCFISP